MQYLLHDIKRLPLPERLEVVEKIINSFLHTDYEEKMKEILEKGMLEIFKTVETTDKGERIGAGKVQGI